MTGTGFRRLFVANRGEVAARVARTCDRLGIVPVFGVSEADKEAPYAQGREKVVLGAARSEHSYLHRERVLEAAVAARCSALHPGWGFLSEDPVFAAMCASRGLTFVGPPAHVMARVGKKSPAKRAMAAAGLSVIPGSDGPVADADDAKRVAKEVGYPVLLKAESGGGGRGMRVVRKASELVAAFRDAQAEAQAAFGDGRLYLEKLIEGGRHVEIQLLADKYGSAVHLGERDCTVQRNHQKLIEESPAPTVDRAECDATLETACAAAGSIGYTGAGTMEFLLGKDGVLRFMEVNARLQVEHPVSEMRTGIDLVEEQIRVALGQPLRLSQAEINARGHAIECRVNAEDPSRAFAPCPGVVTAWAPPEMEGVRVDTHVAAGYEVPPFYDSLLCKVITHAETRDEAIDKMCAALEGFEVEGVATTIPMHLAVLKSEAFRSGAYDTRSIPGWSS